MNNELPKTKIDERTGIEYHLEGDYYIPNIVVPKTRKDYIKQIWSNEIKLLERA